MRTLDEAIRGEEAVADACKEQANMCDLNDPYAKKVAYENGKCAEEHKQIAEWLKELKQLKEKETEKWILVSDRLPDPEDDDGEFSDWVLVTLNFGEMGISNIRTCEAYYCFSEKRWHRERYKYAKGEIVAWKPLPKPYKERWLENAKNMAEEVYEYITKEADCLSVDRKLYFEKVVQYMLNQK